MLKRLGKTITNNFSLKILAVILAVVLWVVVINIDDPTTSKTYTTNVVAENTDYITSQNKYYEPLDSSNVVSFRVSAARSVHDELSNADFSATADMENIEYDEGSGIYRVPVTITAKRYSNKVSVVSKQLYLEEGDYGGNQGNRDGRLCTRHGTDRGLQPVKGFGTGIHRQPD